MQILAQFLSTIALENKKKYLKIILVKKIESLHKVLSYGSLITWSQWLLCKAESIYFSSIIMYYNGLHFLIFISNMFEKPETFYGFGLVFSLCLVLFVIQKNNHKYSLKWNSISQAIWVQYITLKIKLANFCNWGKNDLINQSWQ